MRVALVAGALVLVSLTGVAGAVAVQDEPAPPAVAPPPTAPVEQRPERGPLLPGADGAGDPSAGDPSPTGPTATGPTATGLATALAAGLADPALGTTPAASVLDAATGAVLLDRRGTVPVLPASTAKIATAVAVLAAVEPGTRLTTAVRAGAAPGEVVLVGAGDPTLAGVAAEPGHPAVARLSDLAGQVRLALGGAPPVRVLVDDTLYTGPVLGPGWRPGYVTGGDVAPVMALSVDAGRSGPGRTPRVDDPALAAGTALARARGVPAAEVVRGTAPAGAPELAAVRSPPVEQLVELMLTRSDNDLAEALARRVAIARGLPASCEGGAQALARVLGEVAPDAAPDAFALADGSGLSRLSRLHPTALSRLLAAAAADPAGRLSPVVAGLPVAGFDGTLARRYRDGPSVPAAGVVRAKTGTLEGVSALAGLLRTADGRVLAFDLTADGIAPGANRSAEAALDRLAATLAACGCP